MIGILKNVVNTLQLGRPFVAGHRRYLSADFRKRTRQFDALPRLGDDEHVLAAAQWLATAQDAQPDGGVSGRYKLSSGWTSSYPETTGYLVPTFIRLAEGYGEDAWLRRAHSAIDFLLSIQLPDGAFPGGEIASNREAPSPFNSAQILHGLNAWYSRTADERARSAAQRAASWLTSVQDPDGAFRKFYYCAIPTSYSAHLSCWLAEHAEIHEDAVASNAAMRHLDWVLQHHDSTSGWFDLAGFDEDEHRKRCAYTHTIAYTIWGVLLLGQKLRREDAILCASHAAERVLHRLEISGYLPGMLDASFRPVHRAQCLTGNAQMALIWFELYDLQRDPRYVSGALKALDHVKAAQDLDNPNPGIRGGIAGSLPVWGDYISMAFPNWAAKFFIDAMLVKRSVMATLARRH
jgi:hypothetical protein